MACRRNQGGRLLPAFGIMMLMFVASTAHGADWLIRTKLFEGDSRRASVETNTYFVDGVIYDVLGDPAEVTIFDPAAKRFTLLDAGRKWRTEITTNELGDLTDRLKAAAIKLDDPLFRFAAEPKFDISAKAGAVRTEDSDRNAAIDLVFDSPRLVYRVHGDAPPAAEQSEAYRTFSDWYARLNAVQPGRLPPQARLAVNAELARRGLIPTRVEVKVQSAASGKSSIRRSEHEIIWKFDETDRRRVDDAKALIDHCTSVSFARFHGLDAARRDGDGRR